MKGWAKGGGTVQRDHGINIDIELPTDFEWGYIDTNGETYDVRGDGTNFKTWGITPDINKIWGLEGYDTKYRLKAGVVYLTDAALNLLSETDLLAVLGHEAHHAWQLDYARKPGNLSLMKKINDKEFDPCSGCFYLWAEVGGYQVQNEILHHLGTQDNSQLMTDALLVNKISIWNNPIYDAYRELVDGVNICQPICEIK